MESQMPTLGVTEAYSESHRGLLRESDMESRWPTQGVTDAYSGGHRSLLRESQKPTQGVTVARLRESQWPAFGSENGPTYGATVERHSVSVDQGPQSCSLYTRELAKPREEDNS